MVTMKVVILLLTVAGLAVADRPGAIQVIEKFKVVAPEYEAAFVTGETALDVARQNASDILRNFHMDIITVKEAFVVSVMKQEDDVYTVLDQQDPSVDAPCLGFIRKTTEMQVNLAGVSFTSCINAADEAMNTTIEQYRTLLGTYETGMQELRLLDVFRGDNVFYTPDNIIGKLDNKLGSVDTITPELSDDITQVINQEQDSLNSIRSQYIICMTTAEQSFRLYTNQYAYGQVVSVCGGVNSSS